MLQCVFSNTGGSVPLAHLVDEALRLAAAEAPAAQQLASAKLLRACIIHDHSPSSALAQLLRRLSCAAFSRGDKWQCHIRASGTTAQLEICLPMLQTASRLGAKLRHHSCGFCTADGEAQDDDGNCGRLAALVLEECIDGGAAASVGSWQSEQLDEVARELMDAICTPQQLPAPSARPAASAPGQPHQLLALLIAGSSGASMLGAEALEAVLGRALAALRSSLDGEHHAVFSTQLPPRSQVACQ